MTADVDAFVVTPKILLPIQKLPNKKIWVFRYAFTHTAGMQRDGSQRQTESAQLQKMKAPTFFLVLDAGGVGGAQCWMGEG